MRSTRFVVPVLACLVTVLSFSVAAAADNWIGTWNLNLAASKFSHGPAPKSQTLKFEASEGGFKLTNTQVDADGKSIEGGYVTTFSGKDVPWHGNPDADTASPKRINDNSYENTWKKGGKVTIHAKVVVSADGKTLTITQKGKNAKGQAVNNVSVFDRQ